MQYIAYLVKVKTNAMLVVLKTKDLAHKKDPIILHLSFSDKNKNACNHPLSPLTYELS